MAMTRAPPSHHSVAILSSLFSLFFFFSLFFTMTSAQLSATFYSSSCSNALSIINQGVKAAVQKEARMGASLLRLHFHDCFVNLGGPSWNVLVGRRDSTTASTSGANNNLPAPTLSLSQLITSFSNQGFSTREMVALSGGHTIGQARCTTFRNRIYNDANINATFARSLQSNCPQSGGDNNLAPLDDTPTSFDNAYYVNLQGKRGVFHSDQELFNGGSTDSIVNTYSSNPSTFTSEFASAMLKMSNLSPLTGSSGQVRKNCRRTN